MSPDLINDLNIVGDKYFQNYLLNQINNLDQTGEVINEYKINCKVLEIEDLGKNRDEFVDQHITLHINIHSLAAKYGQLQTIIHRLINIKIQIDFILLCETFLNKKNAHLFYIEGFQLIFKNRPVNKGGGIAIYVNNNINYKRRHDLEHDIENEFESLIIEAKLVHTKIIVGEIYRVPNTNEAESINRYDHILNKLSIEKKDILIGTDQNFDYLKIERHKNTSDLLNTFLSAGLQPTITECTRVTHKTSTIIDNIYINGKIAFSNVESCVILNDISDHYPIGIIYNTNTHKKREPLIFKSRCLDENKIRLIVNDLETIDWNNTLNLDVNNATEKFIRILQEIISRHAPEREIHIPAKQIIRNPWITPAVMKSSIHLDRLYKLQRKKPKHSQQYIEYIKYKNIYNKLKRTSKRNYFTNLLHTYKNDIKKTWKVLNRIIGKNSNKKEISETFINNGVQTSNPKLIAEGFCDYFTHVGEKFAAAIPPSKKHFKSYLKHNINNSLFLSPTDPEEISKIISLLKSKKSCGDDGISSSFLKETKSALKIPLSILINKSLETGQVPKSMKIAKVIPIHKSKNSELYTNYRPISLLPSFSKILEKIVHKRLYNFLDQHNVFFKSQYGFRPKHSTINAITELTSNISLNLDNNQHTVAVLLDLSKAFDTINHITLLNKLKFYGVRGIALEWFKSYLSDRTQYVNYNATKSTKQDITCGVPQGSVLGPLLFIIYTNDLPLSLRYSQCVLFADDTTIYNAANDLQTAINNISHDLNELTEWFKANKLSLNISKTHYMIFTKLTTNNIPMHTLNIGKDNIKRVEFTQFLGIQLDDKLNWQEQIKYIKNKLACGLYALNTAKKLLEREHRKKLYYTLINPHLNYGISLWGSANKSLLKQLHVSQNKAIRAITHSEYNESVNNKYKQLDILQLNDMYTLQLAKFMFQYSKNQLPKPLMELFTPNSDIHKHNTRHNRDPHFISYNTHKYAQSFLHKAPVIWQNIPIQIKDKKTLNSFNINMKKNLGYF